MFTDSKLTSSIDILFKSKMLVFFLSPFRESGIIRHICVNPRPILWLTPVGVLGLGGVVLRDTNSSYSKLSIVNHSIVNNTGSLRY